jgi:hypothetical protein
MRFTPQARHHSGLDLGRQRAGRTGGVVEQVDLFGDGFVFVGDDPRSWRTRV